MQLKLYLRVVFCISVSSMLFLNTLIYLDMDQTTSSESIRNTSIKNLNSPKTNGQNENITYNSFTNKIGFMVNQSLHLSKNNIMIAQEENQTDQLLKQETKSPEKNMNGSYTTRKIEILTNTTGLAIGEIKTLIDEVNKAQRIYNMDISNFSKGENSTVIVIQVHNRSEYLQLLINSLAKAHYIDQALLIFSHDFYDAEINRLILDIKFCAVMQIYYPFSIQLFPNEFRGTDPQDCPRDFKSSNTSTIHCNNNMTRDTYGHYREAKYTQIKHHWFWKLNHVFDAVRSLADYNGLILLDEEDHVVAEDALHVLHQMQRLKYDSYNTTVDIITLGTYSKKPDYTLYSNKVEISPWQSTKHNMGMALDRATWQRIKSCAIGFCNFDDYNWDWSLQHISLSCMSQPLMVMHAIAPRIFHMGSCGLHHKKAVCDPTTLMEALDITLQSAKPYLYPDGLKVSSMKRALVKRQKPNGGWGDQRDQELCMSFVDLNATRISKDDLLS